MTIRSLPRHEIEKMAGADADTQARLGALRPSPRPMIPILTFGRPDVCGRIVVSLGAEPVGEVIPQSGDVVAYRVMLHGLSSAFRPAESASRARAAIERFVNEWLSRLGIFYPGLGVAIAVLDADGAEHTER